MKETVCQGCGASFPEQDGPVHRYMESSPACWAAFGEVLAREYSNPAYFSIHRLTVDTYAVQHPGGESRQAIQSVGVHLVRLYLFLERGLDATHANDAMLEAAKHKQDFFKLEPPAYPGKLTIADVLAAKNERDHRNIVQAWAESAWQSWSAHHDTVRLWAREHSFNQGV